MINPSNKGIRFLLIIFIILGIFQGSLTFAQPPGYPRVNNFTLCKSDNNTLHPNFGTSQRDGNGYWKVIKGYGIFDDSTSHSDVTISNIAFGENIFYFYQKPNTPPDYWPVLFLEHIVNVNNYGVSAGRDTTLCYTVSSYQLNGSDPILVDLTYSGTWSVISGYGEFANANQYNTTVTKMTVGAINTYRWRFNKDLPVCNGGSNRYDDVNITVPSPPNAYAGPDKNTCPLQWVTLTAYNDPTYKYLWSSGSTLNFTTVNPASSTNYKLTVTDANKCTATDDANVFVREVLALNFTGSAPGYCAGSTGVTLKLDSSVVGVNYYLKRGTANIDTLAGTGDSLLWLNMTAGTYTVVGIDPAIPTCPKTMNGSVVVTTYPLPQLQTLTASSNTYCSHTSGVTLRLSDSENGSNFQYQLYKNGNPEGPSRQGTDDTLLWINKTAGNYYVIATNTLTHCTRTMSGNLSITELTSPTVFNVGTSGSYCAASGGLPITLSGSETGVSYQLFKNGSPGSSQDGNGLSITWNGNLYGTYAVQATHKTNLCSRAMNGSATLSEVASPLAFDLQAPAGYCENTNGVTVTLAGSQSGIDYVLSRDGNPLGPIGGSGLPLIWNNMPAGTYTAQAMTTGTKVCTTNMTGSPTVIAYGLPTANAGSDVPICLGSSTQLNASGGNSYSWSPANGLSNISIPNPIASPSSTTMYTVTVTNANGCIKTDQVEVIVRALPDAVTSSSPTICNGKYATLTATDNIVGNNETYLWNTGSTNDTIVVNPSTTTSYYVTITDIYSCKNSASVVVNVNQGPGVNAGSDAQVCKGSPITLAATGDADTWLWSTGATTQSITITPSATSSYTVKGTYTATGCYTIDTVKVTVNNLPIVSFTLNGGTITQYCSNGPLVTLAGTPAGGGFTSTTPGAISGNSFDPVIAGVGPHTITYTYTDAKSCTNSFTRNVDVVAPPTPNITGLNLSYCNSALPVVITGAPLQDGSGNFGSWSFSGPVVALSDNADGTATFDPSAIAISGSYTITYEVANSTGCIGSVSQNVTINTIPTANFIGLPAGICPNSSPVTLTGNQGTSGTFTGSGITDNGNGTATFNPASLAPSNYTITFTYQDPVTLCQSIKNQTVIVNPLPTAFTVTGGGAYCEGAGGVAIGLSNSTNGITYQLLLDGNYQEQLVSTGGVLSFGNKTLEGTYTVKGINTITTCSSNMTGNAVITMNRYPLDAQVIIGPVSVCPLSTPQSYSVPAITYATSYVWLLPLNATIASGSGTNAITVLFASNAASGNISVHGQNACGNGGSSTLPITIKPMPGTVGSITGKTTVCQNEKNVTYSINPVADATSYTWTVPSGATIISGQGTINIIVNFGSASTSGNIAVNGNNSCGNGPSNSEAITVVATPQLTANASSGQINCTGVPVTVSATSSTGGVVYAWTAINGGNIVGATNTSSTTVNAAGDYIIVVTEPVNSCSSRDTVNVISDLQAPQDVNITSSNFGTVTCTVPQVTLTVTTTSIFPVGYQWTASSGGNIVSGSTFANAVVDKGGVYEVKVTNLNTSCYTVKSVTVSEVKASPNISVVDPEEEKLSCTKFTATLTGNSTTSGVSYNWSGPGIVSGGTSATPIVNATGTYTLTVTAPNGCTAVATVQVQNDNSLPQITVTNNPGTLTCITTSLTLNGSSTTAGATLLWTGPGIVSGATTETPVINLPGLYTLTVTHPLTGCTISGSVNVSQNNTTPTITFPVIPATITCGQPNVTIQSNTSATNKTYQWGTSNGTIVSGATNANVIVSKAGIYTLVVTDTDNGCTGNASITTSEDKALPDAQIAAPGTINCTQTSINIAGSSITTPVNVSWSTADGNIVSGGTGFTPNVNKGGTYVMTVINTNTSCSATKSVTVAEDKVKPVISINKTPATLNCLNLQVQLYGTSANSTLLWSGPAVANIVNPTSTTPLVDKQGRYYLTATGTNGCTSKDSVDVTGDYQKPLNVTINAPGTLTCVNTTLQLTGNSTTPSATYLWSASNGGNIISATNNEIVTINAAGDYKMVVTHPVSFCKDSATTTVTQNITAPTISFTLVPATITCTQATSQLNATVVPGGSTLSWTGPGTISNPSISNPIVNTAGTYTLQATHPVSGCISTSTLTVTQNKVLPDIAIAVPAKVTCSQPNVILDGSTSITNYTALWTTSNGTFSGPTNLIDAVVTDDGLYTLTLTNNDNGCSASQNLLVTANNTAPNVIVDTMPAKITCTANQVELYGSSATVGASLLWTGPGNILGPTTERPKVDSAGIYTLTVTGTNGCPATATVTVNKDKTTPAVPSIIVPDTITCTRTTVDLEVSPQPTNVDYLWTTSGSGHITNPTSAITSVDAIGTYTVKVTNRTSGCLNQNSVIVPENKVLPTAVITGAPYVLSCTQKTLQLDGSTSTGINPVWSASGGGHISSGSNTFKPTIDAVGIYMLTVSHATTGCTHTVNINVTKSDDLPGITVGFPADLTCAVTQVTLSGQPTVGGTTYGWKANPGHIVSGDSTYNPVVDQPGMYFFTVTKTATGCANTAAVEVKANTTPPQVNIETPEQFTCTKKQVQLNASSPNTSVSYAWSTSGTGSIKPGDENVAGPIVYTPATYTLSLTDLTNQCTIVRNVVVTADTISPNITVDKSPDQLTCSVKHVVLSGTSSTTGATYLWTTNGTGNISNPTSKTPAVDAIGIYKLKVTNPVNGCFITDSVSVTEDNTPPNIWVNTIPSVLNCARDTVQLKGNSATANVTYLWSGPGNISNSSIKEPFVDAPGIYQLVVTYAVNGCTSTLPVTVTRNVTVPAAPVATGNYTCYGSPATNLTATGNSIQWYNDPVLTSTFKVGSGGTYTPTSVTAIGNYNYYATQIDPTSQCEGPAAQVTYTVRALPAAPINIDKSICQGSANPSLQASGSSINWYDVPGGTLIGSGNSYTPLASVSAPGSYTYYATQTDGYNCESNAQGVTLTIHPNPATPVVSPLTASVCFGEVVNPSFNASGNNLKWYASASLPAPIATGSVFTPLETSVGIYNYYVTQTSVNGCVSPYETVTFNINALPQNFIVTGGGVYCENLNGLAVGLNGSENSTAYELLLDGSTIITSMNGTGNPLDFGLQKAEGNYTVIAYGSNGCSTSMTGGVSIVANKLPGPAGSITGSITACQGATNVPYSIPAVANALSYTWSVPTGATITSGLNSNAITIDYSSTAVTGQLTVYASNSCGSGAISPNLQVIVNPLPAAAGAITGDDVICLGDTGIIYEVGAIANATTYEWQLPAGVTIYSGINTRQIRVRFENNAATGSQTIRVRGANSCGKGAYSASFNITVTPAPSVYAGIDQNICTQQSTLQGSSVPVGGSGVWGLLSGYTVITNNTANNSTITSVSQGTTKLTWSITLNGCTSVDTVSIINNTLLVDAGQDIATCATELTLKGSALPTGSTGIWSVASGTAAFTAASQPGTKASNFGYGDNKLYWTATKNGCSSRDSVLITNYRPTTPDAGGNQNLCTNQTWLSGNQPVYGTGLWSVYSGSVSITNPSLPNTQISAIAKGTNVLIWTITNQMCSLWDTVTIWNNSNDAKAGYDQVLCENRTTLDATPPKAGETGRWSVLEGSAAFVDGYSYNSKVSGLITGINKLIWSISKDACVNTDTVVLTCNMPSIANAGPDEFIGGSATTLQANQPSVGSGKWGVLSGAGLFNNDTLFNTTVGNLIPGANILRWTITYKGCSTFDDVMITNGTIEQVEAGSNQTICDNKTRLEATRAQYGYSYWTVQKGSANFEDNEAYNSLVTNLAPGENILKWSVIISGIEFYDSVIIVNNLPTQATVGPNQALCGDSSMLTGSIPVEGTGRWTVEGGSGTIDNNTLYNSKVTHLWNGDNFFRWTIIKGACVSSTVLIISNNQPTIADAGLDQTICDNQTTLIPNTPFIGAGEWSVMSGAGSFTNNLVTGLAPGVNTLRWTISKSNCSYHDDVIIISHKPTPASAGLNSTVCIDSLYLAANKENAALGEFGRWTIMNGAGTFADSTLNTTLIRGLALGKNVLRWTINNNGCLSYGQVEINYAYTPSIAGTNLTTCDDHVMLNANNPGIGAGEWSIIGGSGSAIFVSPSSPNTEVKNLDKGNNVLRWTITNLSCISTSEMIVTNNSPSEAFAGGDQTLCTNTTTLSAKPILIGNGKWSVLSGSGRFSDTTAYNATVTTVGTGSNTYRWTVTNANCFLSDEVVISNSRPINTNAGLDQSLCSDSASLSANNPLVGKGVWSITKGAGLINDAYNSYTKIRKLSPDTTILRWTVTNKQCTEFDEVTLVNNLPTVAAAGADRTICQNYIALNGNVPQYGTGEWSVISGAATFTNANSYSSYAQNLMKGDNILRWKISKQNCSFYDDVTITNDSPTAPDAGTNLGICDNTVGLNGNKPVVGVGYWSVVSGAATIIDSTLYNTQVVGLGQGANVLRWTITHNLCTAYDLVEIRNNLTNVYAGPDQTVYENFSKLIGSTPSRGTGFWTLEAGAGTLGSADKTETYVTDLGPGINTFAWSVNIEGCVSFDRVQITYFVLPTAEFTVNQSQGCPPLEVHFTKTTADNYPFKWEFGENDSVSHVEHPNYTYTQPGTYTARLTLTGQNGKLVTREQIITVYDVPKAIFEITPSEVYIPEQELRCYNYSQKASTYLWDFGDGNTSDEYNVIHTYTDSGFYTVMLKVWTNHECSDSMTIVNGVHVIEKSRIKFPKAFTPNQNGPSEGRYNRNDFSNDVFYPIVLMGGLREYKIEIYNRWGVLLFESNDINIGWDGYYKNKLLMEDVYIYRASGVYNDGKKFSITGDVLLMKR